MLILKWILKAIRNSNTPPEAIIWILALKFRSANIKQDKVDRSIPIKKKYSSVISLDGSKRWTINKIIIQFIVKGIIRSLGVAKLTVFTFRNVFNTKKRSMGRMIVSNTNEYNFTLIIGKGIKRGDFVK